MIDVPFVIGLGSYHGDDRAGWLAIDQLQALGYPQQRLHRARSPAGILDTPLEGRRLIICDACEMVESSSKVSNCSINQDFSEEHRNGCEMKINRLIWPADRILYQRGTGSHDLDLADVLKLGNALQATPPTAEIWTIQGRCWKAGTEPSLEVRSASQQVARQIWSRYQRA